MAKHAKSQLIKKDCQKQAEFINENRYSEVLSQLTPKMQLADVSECQNTGNDLG